MKILIIGAGPRAHALTNSCLKSPLVKKVLVAPGNDGIQQDAECHWVDLKSPDSIIELAFQFKPDLIIVGPEGPVSLGLVDALRSQDIPVYGASKEVIQLEYSKKFARYFMRKYGIPTPSFAQFNNAQEALDCLRGERFPTVLKSDALRETNGVVIAHSYQEAEDAIRLLFDPQTLTGTQTEILVEEFLKGEEVAVTLMVCGEKYVTFPFTQDYIRLNEHNNGPATAGMGSYAPTHLITPHIKELLVKTIIEPTLYGFKHEGFDYRGTLQIGIILTANGPKAIDFKVRFGDPSCQALMPLFQTDPVEAFLACAQGKLDPECVQFNNKSSVVVVKSIQGYPFAFNTGEVIQFPEQLPIGTALLHSGTKKNKEGQLVTNQGRVIHINAVRNTLVEAAMEAYALCQKVTFPSEYYRKDIALKAIEQM